MTPVIGDLLASQRQGGSWFGQLDAPAPCPGELVSYLSALGRTDR
jgi:hypothetical protein